MYNLFSGNIKPDSLYVYGLYNDDYLFYIGVTENLYVRYKSHFSEYLCSAYIMQMRLKDNYPNVKIFGAFNGYQQAEAAEHSLIRLHCLLKHKLCNHHQNDKDNKLITPRTNSTPKRMPQNLHIKIIDEAIDNYKKYRQWANQFYSL